MSFNNTAIVYVKGSAYTINFWYMGKDDAINIMNGSIVNGAKDYYENNKERLRLQARDKYRNLSEEKKIKKENME